MRSRECVFALIMILTMFYHFDTRCRSMVCPLRAGYLSTRECAGIVWMPVVLLGVFISTHTAPVGRV